MAPFLFRMTRCVYLRTHKHTHKNTYVLIRPISIIRMWNKFSNVFSINFFWERSSFYTHTFYTHAHTCERARTHTHAQTHTQTHTCAMFILSEINVTRRQSKIQRKLNKEPLWCDGWVCFRKKQKRIRLPASTQRHYLSQHIKTWRILLVCVYTYIYMSIYIHIRIFLFVSYSTHTYNDAVHMQECINVYIHICSYTYVYMHKNIYTCTSKRLGLHLNLQRFWRFRLVPHKVIVPAAISIPLWRVICRCITL